MKEQKTFKFQFYYIANNLKIKVVKSTGLIIKKIWKDIYKYIQKNYMSRYNYK